MSDCILMFKQASINCRLDFTHVQHIRASVLTSICYPMQVPSIQQSAALALGRLANHSDDLAEDVVANEILPQLVYSLGEQNVCETIP